MPSQKLAAAEGHLFESGKTYTHAQGLSCCFRQWRARDSHCRFLHGYSLQVTITFRSIELDDRNWVVNFGGLKWLKQWLEETFDHKTLVAKDDPNYESFRTIAYFKDPLIQMVEVDHVGCEAFAKMIFDYVDKKLLEDKDTEEIMPECVEVREHEGNFARYRRNS